MKTCELNRNFVSYTLQGAGGIGGLISVTESSTNSLPPATYYPAYDAIRLRASLTTPGQDGNITEYADTNGTIVAHYEYNPFGGLITSSGTKANDCKFRVSTKYFDVETGLYYYGYRYYSADLGRWINRDPIGINGGLNIYCFVGNESLGRSDKLGLWFVGPFPDPWVAPAPDPDLPPIIDPWPPWPEDGMMTCIKQIVEEYKLGLGNCGVPGCQPSDPDDQYQHCLSSCRLGKNCGDKTSAFLGFGKELRDEIWKKLGLQDEGASLEDFMANSKGRGCADDPDGCECCCKR